MNKMKKTSSTAKKQTSPLSKVTKVAKKASAQTKRPSSSSRKQVKGIKRRGGGPDDGTVENVLYLGAGGGGDTTAAMVRAMVDDTPNINKFVMGAGYKFDKEYEDALLKGSRKDRKAINDIKSNSNANNSTDNWNNIIQEYLRNTLQKDEKTNAFVYKFDANKIQISRETEKSLFSKLVPDSEPGKTYTDLGSGFKYKSLLDERIAIQYFSEKCPEKFSSIRDNIFMLQSVDNVNTEMDTIDTYYSLLEFIEIYGINRIVVMDFGGDVFDYNKLSRDTCTLLMLLFMMKNESVVKFTLDVEVYGPGCDSHESVMTTLENMKSAMGDITSLQQDASKLANFLLEHRYALYQYEILGKGRATGNFLKAYVQANADKYRNVNAQTSEFVNKGKKDPYIPADTDNDELKSWIWSRHDVKAAIDKCNFVKSNNLTEDEKPTVKDELKKSYEKFKEHAHYLDTTSEYYEKLESIYKQLNGSDFNSLVAEMSKMYKYSISDNNNTIFTKLHNSKEAYKHGYSTLQEKIHPKKSVYEMNKLRDRFVKFRGNKDLIKQVLDYEKNYTIDNTLKGTSFPVPVLGYLNPFTLIAESDLITRYSLEKMEETKYEQICKAFERLNPCKDLDTFVQKVDGEMTATPLSDDLRKRLLSPRSNTISSKAFDRYFQFISKNNATNKSFPAYYYDPGEKYKFVFILNAKLPMTEWYTQEAQGLPGMGLIHLLALPKTRKYNIFSLDNNDVGMLQSMRDKANEMMKNQIVRLDIVMCLILQVSQYLKSNTDDKSMDIELTKNKEGIIKSLNILTDNFKQSTSISGNGVKQLVNQMKKNEIVHRLDVIIKANDQNLKKFAEYVKKLLLCETPTMEFFLHGHPDHSVGYLHLHCVSSGTGPGDYSFRTSRVHDHKNIPLDNAIAALQDVEPIETLVKPTPQEGGKRKSSAKKVGLEKLTVAELADRAKAKGVVNVRQYKKDQLVSILRGEIKVPRKKPVAKKYM